MTGNKKTKNGRYYPSIKLWARAVVRDEVLGTKAMLEAGDIEDWEVGQPVGFQDHLIDHEETDKEGKPTGKTVKRPEIVVINQSQQNFFGAVEANALSYGSACDRDYKVTREGSELDTTYSIVAMDPIIEELESGKRRKWSLANAAVKAEYLKHAPDLEEVITDQASDEYFARFFDTRVEAPKRGKAKEKATEVDEDGVGSGAAETEDTEDVATDVADMRARLESRVGKKPVAATTGADED
jgi:hypothetical protein